MINFKTDPDFFIIDSENLDSVTTKFYGYTIIDNEVIIDIRDIRNEKLTGSGAYIFIDKKDEEISVYQDFIGSYGLYYYVNETGFFALSNSFLKLVEYLIPKYPISLNRNYAEYMVAADICSVAYGMTIINEIRVLDRNIIAKISIDKHTIDFVSIDYDENTVSLDSSEGIKILDDWANRWSGVLRNLCECSTNLLACLSGGFDSRMTFALLLYSNIDLNKVFVYSINDDKYVHPEDYQIASSIAEKYDFILNYCESFDNTVKEENINDIMDRSFNVKLFFHKQMYYLQKRNMIKYSVFGGGGECLRNYWDVMPEEYIDKAVNNAEKISSKLTGSTRLIIEESLQNIERKYEKIGRPLSKERQISALYRETRCRNHFGRNAVEAYLSNSVLLYPLLDPMLHKLKLYDSQCSDNNLLMALIFTRFCPDLLDFKFDSGKYIEKTTIQEAQRINKLYESPEKRQRTNFSINSDKGQEKRLTLQKISGAADEIMLRALKSDIVKKITTSYFDENIYMSILKDVNTRNHYPTQNLYLPLGLVKLICMLKNQKQPHVKFSDFYIALSETESFNNDIKIDSIRFSPFPKDNINAQNHRLGIILEWEKCFENDDLKIYRQSGDGIRCIATVSQRTGCYVDTEVKEDCWGKVFSYYIVPNTNKEDYAVLHYSWIRRLSTVTISNIKQDENGNVILYLKTDFDKNKAAGYEIQYSSVMESFTNNGSWNVKIVTGRKNNRVLLSKFEPNTTYYFRVRAYSDYVNQKSGFVKRSWSPCSPFVSYHTSVIHNKEKKVKKLLNVLFDDVIHTSMR